MEVKIIKSGDEAVDKFIKGIEIVDKMVGDTLGPAGRNRIISRKYRSPLVTNDGVTVARNIVLDDEIEDMAAQTLVEIAMKTNEVAGDGTTTSVVAGAALAINTFKRLKKDNEQAVFQAASVSPITYAKEIWAELPKVLKMLKDQAVPVEGDMLDQVIATSLENLEYGVTLGELFRQVGKDGYISTEDNWGTKYGIDTEVTRGMRFLGTYASPYLATERNQKEAVWENTHVLVCNQRIEKPATLAKLIKEMDTAKLGKLVIIAGFSEGTNPYSKEFIEGLAKVMQAAQVNPNIIKILAIKAPTLTSNELEDVAVFTDARFIDKTKGDKLTEVSLRDCGFAAKIVVTEDDVNIIGGRGNTEERIAILKGQMEIEKDAMFLEKLKRRIASLSAGVGIIRVGAPTEQERTYLKYKLEDAVNAAKAALEEGIVPGAGIALMRIADELGAEHILYPALMAPYDRIRSNAGGELEVPDTIVDPHKVVRLAFTNACSAAAALISTDGGIADRRQTVFDSFAAKMGKMNPHSDDFRADENQDLGRGRSV
jgi:chaperonin GroEL